MIMKRVYILALFLSFVILAGYAQTEETIDDEGKVPAYTLPALLESNAGRKITTVEQWEEIRRPELLTLFTEQVYGKSPVGEVDVSYRKLDDNHSAVEGSATRKQIEITFSKNGVRRKALLLLYLPNQIKTPVPVFFACNFQGNQTISTDPDIIVSSDNPRGCAQSRWPVSKIIDAGYGLATVYYFDFFPDRKDGHAESVLALFGIRGEQDIASDGGQALSAWAWGISRMMDYFETDRQIDASRIILMGHSRLGKAALWAGAQDSRFSIVISNCSGCGGAALSKRAFGETVGTINNAFPHWFCKNFRQYGRNEVALPVDQHELIALIAPRPVYVASAEEDLWADPKGEFLSAFYAGDVYRLYGLEGLQSDVMPVVNSPVVHRVAYHIRTGKHDVTDFDWENYIKFADKWLK